MRDMNRKPLQEQITTNRSMIVDLANQHQQIAVNHAELLKMILQLQRQIDHLRTPAIDPSAS